jgi:hypothetical protein
MEDYREDNNICLSPRVSKKKFHNLRHETSKHNHNNSFTINKCRFPLTSPRIIKQITLVEDPPHENSQNTPIIASFKKCAQLISVKKPLRKVKFQTNT